jgi:protein-S-isoprenylcysteine O-methyltransferase Ste14
MPPFRFLELLRGRAYPKDMKNNVDSPDVIALPPLIFVGGLFVGLAIDLFLPQPFIPEAYDLPLGLVIIALGIFLIAWAAQRFADAKTEIDVRKTPTAIVTQLPYSMSRNPMYLGMTIILLGFAIWLNSLWILSTLIFVHFVLHFGVIMREEAYLERKFGKTYLEYKKKVRRWI